MDYRMGIGYDMHPLAAGRPLVLGGVCIPYERGLAGHSDADVLVHAVCDALLGAAGLGDIGMHFPDSDPRYRGIDSLLLLRETVRMIRQKGFRVANVDVCLIAEAPKISPYREAMRQNIANTVEIEACRINIKATTTEGLGSIGRGEGMAAMSTALIVGAEIDPVAGWRRI